MPGTEMTAKRCAVYGDAAIRAGSPDVGKNGDDADGRVTDAADAIANVLHAVELRDGREAADAAIRRAQMHFDAERDA